MLLAIKHVRVFSLKLISISNNKIMHYYYAHLGGFGNMALACQPSFAPEQLAPRRFSAPFHWWMAAAASNAVVSSKGLLPLLIS